MANTIDTYGDAAVMAALLTRSFAGVGYEFEDDVVTTLRNYAFAGVTDLQRLSLPNLTMIPTCCFYGTEVSGTVTLPWNKITLIGAAAFFEGTVMKESSLTMPALVQIGMGSFAGQQGLTSFSGPVLESIYSETAPFSQLSGVFEGSGIQTFSAPNFKDTNFSRKMFKDCASLTSVNFPKQTSVAESMFENCTSLTSISMPEAIYCMGNYGFRGCTALTSVSLPNVVYVTANNEFEGCTALESISLPEAEGTMGYYFFAYCSNLRTVSLPKMTELPTSCFRECTSLTFAGLTIPNVTTLSAACFQGCTALTTFTSDKITSIGTSCFYENSNLEEVSFSKVTAIPQNCFYNCTKLKKITLSGPVTSFGATAFRYCRLLDTVILSGVTAVPTINSNTFQSATLITNGTGVIYVPDNLVASFQADSTWRQYNIQSINNYNPS